MWQSVCRSLGRPLFELLFELEGSPKMHQRTFRDTKIDLYLALLRGPLVRLLKLVLERFDSLFEKCDVLAQGPLHLVSISTEL